MPTNGQDRLSPSDLLREEFGITEIAGKAGNYSTGTPLCTAGELRALRAALQLSMKQFSARFRVPLGTLYWWSKSPTATTLHVSVPDVHAKLLPVVQRAQELGLLARDPKPDTGTAAQKKRAGGLPRSPYKPRGTMVRFRCTQCGEDLRKRDALTDSHGDLYHEKDGEGCGPVRAAVAPGITPGAV